MILNILKKFMLIIYIFIILLMIRRIYVNDVIRNKIRGNDKYMTSSGENCYCSGQFQFKNTKNREFKWNQIKKNVKKYLEKNNKKIRIFYNLKTKKYDYNNSFTVDDFCFNSNSNFNEIINDKNLHKKMGFFFINNPKDNIIYFFMDHNVTDLINSLDILELSGLNFEKIKNIIPEYKYYPFLSELNMIRSVFKFIFIKSNKIKYDKKLSNKNIFVSSKINSDLIANYKNNYKFKSAHICLALACQKIFNAVETKLNFLNIGILVGMKNKRFKNNYSIIPIVVKNTDIITMIKSIKKEIKKNYIYGLGFYDLSNYTFSEIQNYRQNKIDVLYTNVYANCDTDFENSNFIIDQVSSAFYVTSISINDNNYISFQHNVSDVNIEKLKF